MLRIGATFASQSVIVQYPWSLGELVSGRARDRASRVCLRPMSSVFPGLLDISRAKAARTRHAGMCCRPAPATAHTFTPGISFRRAPIGCASDLLIRRRDLDPPLDEFCDCFSVSRSKPSGRLPFTKAAHFCSYGVGPLLRNSWTRGCSSVHLTSLSALRGLTTFRAGRKLACRPAPRRPESTRTGELLPR